LKSQTALRGNGHDFVVTVAQSNHGRLNPPVDEKLEDRFARVSPECPAQVADAHARLPCHVSWRLRIGIIPVEVQPQTFDPLVTVSSFRVSRAPGAPPAYNPISISSRSNRSVDWPRRVTSSSICPLKNFRGHSRFSHSNRRVINRIFTGVPRQGRERTVRS